MSNKDLLLLQILYMHTVHVTTMEANLVYIYIVWVNIQVKFTQSEISPVSTKSYSVASCISAGHREPKDPVCTDPIS